MLGNSLLLLASLAGAILLLRRSEPLPETSRSHLQVGSLSLAFVAMAALGQLLPLPHNQDTATLQRLLGNLATYAGLPLLATAMLALAMGRHWSKAGWGRWLLALFALFELFRRMGLGDDYTFWLSLALAASLLIAAWLLPDHLSRLMCALAAPLLLLSLSAPKLMGSGLSDTALQMAQAAALLLISGSLLRHPQAARI
ncbi:hypothetical protein [Marinobacterium marinum]|uniref:NADH:quinone oxidoreductase/Mrp antiporter membrane subunit domain-containing protein n=1 Tax=Marinobacterium marinum TaxID=2756129 RepID=A0A7W1WV46_9GAMM|nr:hypothetical protein [Marinobacterium marinum]MBA4500799.1 hypothetical protein [Marinobacterium marinum]